ncbi:MAG: hypothetical protein ACSLE2_18145 [Lysobacterales bacterium]
MLGAYLDLFFCVLAAVFGVLAWRQRRRLGPDAPATRTWLRLAVLFLVVGLLLAWKLRLSGA